jgi:hypothetical protein
LNQTLHGDKIETILRLAGVPAGVQNMLNGVKIVVAHLMKARFSVSLGQTGVAQITHRRITKKEKTFDALEWLAAMCSHVPNRGEQMVRYYGYYRNLCRGKREKQKQDDTVPYILEPDKSLKERRKNWASLIQKIYKVDPLTCPKCFGTMKVISIIEDEEVIKKILKHLNLWDIKTRPPPKATCLRADTHRQAGPPKPLKHAFDYYTLHILHSSKSAFYQLNSTSTSTQPTQLNLSLDTASPQV